MAQTHTDPTQSIIGSTPAINELREQIRHLTRFDSVRSPHVPTVLLCGETGTGKGLVARALHDSGPRAAGPFVDVNCAAIPETMLEAELFGYEPGAFTDAKKAKVGLFEAATGGCLFLDEIDSLSLPLQGKLLKAIEEKSVRRLGAVTSFAVDAKLIAATQRNLSELVAAGGFRADLYHRLAVVVLLLPPLRERVDDIVPLARYYLDRYADAHGLDSRELTPQAIDWLRSHPWSGNVRELGNLMERVTLLATEATIGAETLARLSVLAPPTLSAAPPATARADEREAPQSTTDADGDVAAIRDALGRSGGNVARAARLLGIGRNALRYRMRRHGIDRPALDPPGQPAESTPGEAAAGSAAAPDAAPAPRWEEKTAAVLAIEMVFSRRTEGELQGDPWTRATRWQRTIEDHVIGFGGILLSRSPSRLTAVFGVPRALEQTPQRAVQAALAIQRAAKDARRARDSVPELRFAVHIGAAQVDVASADRQLELLPLGDTLALPERLLGHANDGEILVSSQIARRVGDSCDCEERDLRLGDGEETRFFTVSGSRRPARAGDGLRFVGRRRELEILRDSFQRAAEENGQVVFIVGDAGIGKSRLLQELRRGLAGDDHAWIEGRCTSYGNTTAFLPIIDGVRRYFEIDDRDDEASARAKIETRIATLGDDLGWVLPFVHQLLALRADADVTALDSASRRSETSRALKAIFMRQAEQRPLVLVIEDLHWIDEASEEFLTFLAEVVPTSRILLVCSYRPGYRQPFGDRSYHLRLALSPLSRHETADMAGLVLGVGALPRDVEELIARKAEGNPFFIEEITASLLEDGSLRRVGERIELTRDLAEIDVPDAIQDVLAARIDRLPEESKRAIQIASVIGREFALRLLERIAEAGSSVRSRVDELRAVELIYEKAMHPELAYMFKHALTHDVAYHSVQQVRRIHLHRLIGLAIEELYADRLAEHYETLAHHFEVGEAWQRAFHYHELAAGKAAESHANHSVVHHTRSALHIGVRLGADFGEERECVLEERLGLALFYLSEYAESGRAFERAAARAGDAERRATLLVSASLSYFWAHEYDRAGNTSASALELSRREKVPGVESATLYISGTYAAIVEGDLETFARLCGSALVLERASGSEFAAAIGSFAQAELYEWTAEYHKAVEFSERGIALGRKLRQSHLIVWPMWFGGKALCCLGEYTLALARLREAFEICDRIGDRAWRSRLLNTLGWCYAEMGAIETAADHNRRAAAIAHEFGDPEIIANSEINLALNRLALGDRDGAEQIIGPVRQRISEPGDPWMRWRFSLHAMHANALLALAKGDPETALGEAREAQERAARHRAVKLEERAALVCGRALLDLERRDEARAATERAISLARTIAHPHGVQRGLAQLATIEERAGRGRQARALVEQAAQTLEQIAQRVPDDLRPAIHRAASGS